MVEGDGKGSTTVLRASDAVAHVMDALYLQAGAGMLDTDEQDLPESTAERARILARWIDDPVASDVLDTEWIAPPQACRRADGCSISRTRTPTSGSRPPVPVKADTVGSSAE